MYLPRSFRCTNNLRLLRNCFIRISEQWLQEAPEHANPMILIQKQSVSLLRSALFSFLFLQPKSRRLHSGTPLPFLQSSR